MDESIRANQAQENDWLSQTLNKFFGPDGTLAAHLKGYEMRESQLAVAQKIGESFQNGGTLLMEAGTGVGKTLAYLVPGILIAKQINRQLLVATTTKTLQQQLIKKELPFLQEFFDPDMRFALFIGAENYACRRRLLSLIHNPQEDLLPNNDMVDSLSDWESQTTTGLLAEAGVRSGSELHLEIGYQPEACRGSFCEQSQACFLQKARRRVQQAHVVVANHHVLLTCFRNNSEMLQNARLLVVDEAHTFDQTATKCLGLEISKRSTHRMWTALLGTDRQNGLISKFKSIGKNHRQAIYDEVALAREEFDALLHSIHVQFPATSGFRRAIPLGEGRTYLQRFENLFQGIHATMSVLSSAVEVEDLPEFWDVVQADWEGVSKDISHHLEILTEDKWVVWYDLLRTANPVEPDISFQVSCIEPGALLGELLYPRFDAKLFISATLSTGESFAYSQERLELPGAETMKVDSPYDYAENLLLYLPDNLPDPSDYSQHEQVIAEELAELLDHTTGGVFVLCTSFNTVRGVYQKLLRASPRLVSRDRWSNVAEGIPFQDAQRLLLQHGEAPRNELLEIFRRTPGSVMIGAATFWQGVDLPGKELELVVIARLPFQVPDDPLLEAQVQVMRKHRRNPFMELQVPYAVQVLRQGIGRLIRSHRDRGVAVILDHRIRTKRYGQIFLDSLPAGQLTTERADVIDFLEQIRVQDLKL